MVVRSLPAVTVEECEAILRDVEYNIFNFPAGFLTVDFLTDSGTSAMTDVQWAACKIAQPSQLSLQGPSMTFNGAAVLCLGLAADQNRRSDARR